MLRRLVNKIRGTAPYDTSRFGGFGVKSQIGIPLSIINPQYIEIGDRSTIFANSRLDCWTSYEHIKLSPKLKIGNNVSIGFNFSAHVTDEIEIGNDVLIASYVLLTTQNHGMDPENDKSYQRQPLISKPIKICDGVWIGEKVTILPGVTVGEKVIIGANSVVSKDIPPFSIAVGMPAKVIKRYDFEKHEWVKV